MLKKSYEVAGGLIMVVEKYLNITNICICTTWNNVFTWIPMENSPKLLIFMFFWVDFLENQF